VSVFLSGRPLWVNPELNASTAFVAAWLPGTEGGGVADVLFRDSEGQVNFDFTGKLSFSWPRNPSETNLNRGDPNYEPLFQYGFGLAYGVADTLSDELVELGGSVSRSR
jgi:beta-glucosidase